MQRSTQLKSWQGLGLVTLLSLFAFAIQGYHPYSEDGGLYVAGIQRALDPALYAVRPEFVLAHLRFSPFAAAVAGVTRWSHLPLPWVLLALDFGSVWVTLYAGWLLISRCTETLAARSGAVALLACWLTMPIAGTSLVLLDPYVTARSFSTPLTLLALAGALDASLGGRLLCAATLILAIVHPLMAGYAVATVIMLLVVTTRHPWLRRFGPWGLVFAAVAAASLIQCLAPAESPDYLSAAMTRRYWFPQYWQWHEQAGLVAPLLVLAGLSRWSANAAWRAIARVAILLGIAAMAVALPFCRAGLATHLVARLQPLRAFQIVYELLFLLLGAWLAERWLAGRAWRWALLLACLGGIMFAAQRSIYPASAHIELPAATSRNPYVQAFVWIRSNTPRDALFALDPHYITRPGEDAQGFRAIAAHSVLPDYSKDGGEASITPALAPDWVAGQTAQAHIDAEDDTARLAALRPYGVTWVVLERKSDTDWICPYENAAVKVCQVP